MTIDIKAIRDVALVTSDSKRMQFKPSTIIALLDRLEAAEKDAARYRWLRVQHNSVVDCAVLDAEIDKAMEAVAILTGQEE